MTPRYRTAFSVPSGFAASVAANVQPAASPQTGHAAEAKGRSYRAPRENRPIGQPAAAA